MILHEADALREAPPLPRATWRRLPGAVTHVFTHFPLELIVYVAELGAKTRAPQGTRWVAVADASGEALPNLMRKVLAHALGKSFPRAAR